MWSRILKQILYGSLYLALWAAFVFLIYILFLKPAPSCFDKIQNQGESGVDCGGPCATLCLPPTLQPLAKQGSVFTLPIDAGHVSILTLVANPNQDEAARNFGYNFTLYAADGTTTVATVSGNSYAYANEAKYLVFPSVAVSALPARTDLAITNPSWVPAGSFTKPDLAIPNYATTISPDGWLKVDGTIANHDLIAFSRVDLIAIFYGDLGTPIGVSETQLDNLGLNASQSFTILHPMIAGADLAATKVFSYAYRP